MTNACLFIERLPSLATAPPRTDPSGQLGRTIIRVSVTRISDSCGFGVPLYCFEGGRTQLTAWAERKGEGGLREYQLANNRTSLDGLPALRGEKL